MLEQLWRPWEENSCDAIAVGPLNLEFQDYTLAKIRLKLILTIKHSDDRQLKCCLFKLSLW